MHENVDDLQPSLKDLIEKLSKVDLILVEALNSRNTLRLRLLGKPVVKV